MQQPNGHLLLSSIENGSPAEVRRLARLRFKGKTGRSAKKDSDFSRTSDATTNPKNPSENINDKGATKNYSSAANYAEEYYKIASEYRGKNAKK
jgi:hypothetical protein